MKQCKDIIIETQDRLDVQATRLEQHQSVYFSLYTAVYVYNKAPTDLSIA